VTNLLKSLGLFGEQALVKNDRVFTGQAFAKGLHLVAKKTSDLLVSQNLVNPLPFRWQEVDPSRRAPIVSPYGYIQRHLSAGQAPIHRKDVLWAHVESFRNPLRCGIDAKRTQPSLFFLQVEEKFSLGLRRA